VVSHLSSQDCSVPSSPICAILQLQPEIGIATVSLADVEQIKNIDAADKDIFRPIQQRPFHALPYSCFFSNWKKELSPLGMSRSFYCRSDKPPFNHLYVCLSTEIGISRRPQSKIFLAESRKDIFHSMLTNL
jgi:hypothetical protein